MIRQNFLLFMERKICLKDIISKLHTLENGFY